jgi:hypothetical protein
MPDDHEARLTILERAQLLHDATLRRHGEILDRHDEYIALLRGLMEQQTRTQADLREIADRLTQRQDQHEEIMRRLAQTLDAIRDMLDRGNGR